MLTLCLVSSWCEQHRHQCSCSSMCLWQSAPVVPLCNDHCFSCFNPLVSILPCCLPFFLLLLLPCLISMTETTQDSWICNQPNAKHAQCQAARNSRAEGFIGDAQRDSHRMCSRSCRFAMCCGRLVTRQHLRLCLLSVQVIPPVSGKVWHRMTRRPRLATFRRQVVTRPDRR